MTPIEQVRPATPGNWTRRPESRIKPGNEHNHRKPADQQRSGRNPGRGPGDDHGEREHIVDELA